MPKKARPKKAPPASEGLGDRGQTFWNDVTGEYELSAPERELLLEACRTLDSVQRLQGVLEEGGNTVEGSRGQVRVHPALTELRQQRVVLGKLLAMLGLPDDSIETPASIRGRKAAESRWAGKPRRTR